MNSDAVFDVIERVALTASKKEKEDILRSEVSNDLLADILERMYCPFRTYGVRAIPQVPHPISGVEFDSETLQVLDMLVTRELSGSAAIDAIFAELSKLNEKSSELFRRIIRKNARAGFSESTINKVWKGKIKEFPYMRCALPKDTDFSKWPWARGVIVQEKADGMFANVDHEVGGLVSIRSRQGSEFPMEKFTGLANDIRNTLSAGFQNHGEVLVYRDGNICERQDGNGVLNSVLAGGDFAANEVPVFYVWDQIPLDQVVPKGKYATGYKIRLFSLAAQIKDAGDIRTTHNSVQLIPTKVVRSLADAFAMYREILLKGKEGVVVKHPDAIWKDTTSKEQIKLKLQVDVDLKITSIVPGKEGGKNEGRAGSLTCETSDGLLRVDVTVKNEAMRESVDASPDEWVGRIIAVRANAVLSPSESNELSSLFLPRMIEAAYRTDKSEADSLTRVRDQFESAVKSAVKAA